MTSVPFVDHQDLKQFANNDKPIKDFVRARFQDWYVEEICKQLERKVNEDIDMGMKMHEPLTAQWMIVELCNNLDNKIISKH